MGGALYNHTFAVRRSPRGSDCVCAGGDPLLGLYVDESRVAVVLWRGERWLHGETAGQVERLVAEDAREAEVAVGHGLRRSLSRRARARAAPAEDGSEEWEIILLLLPCALARFFFF